MTTPNDTTINITITTEGNLSWFNCSVRYPGCSAGTLHPKGPYKSFAETLQAACDTATRYRGELPASPSPAQAPAEAEPEGPVRGEYDAFYNRLFDAGTDCEIAMAQASALGHDEGVRTEWAKRQLIEQIKQWYKALFIEDQD